MRCYLLPQPDCKPNEAPEEDVGHDSGIEGIRLIYAWAQ